MIHQIDSEIVPRYVAIFSHSGFYQKVIRGVKRDVGLNCDVIYTPNKNQTDLIKTLHRGLKGWL